MVTDMSFIRYGVLNTGYYRFMIRVMEDVCSDGSGCHQAESPKSAAIRSSTDSQETDLFIRYVCSGLEIMRLIRRIN